MSQKKLYRNRVGGGVAEYDDAFAAANASVLELVPDGTKPLAYLPISPEAIESLRAASTEAEPDTDVEPAPTPEATPKAKAAAKRKAA